MECNGAYISNKDLQGVIGGKAKIKSATVIHVIRINLNRSNKIFTYQNMYLKSMAMQCNHGEGTSSVING